MTTFNQWWAKLPKDRRFGWELCHEVDVEEACEAAWNASLEQVAGFCETLGCSGTPACLVLDYSEKSGYREADPGEHHESCPIAIAGSLLALTKGDGDG